MRSQAEQAAQPWRGPIPQEVMQFWGYKFETLATLPAPWGETSREYIEGREQEVVNNKAQYCSVVRTGLGKTVLCLGGEVDAREFAFSPLNHPLPLIIFQLLSSPTIQEKHCSSL
jgi:RAT1-interacting protein